MSEMNMGRTELLKAIHELSGEVLAGVVHNGAEGVAMVEIGFLAAELAKKSQVDIDMWLTSWYDGEAVQGTVKPGGWVLRLMKSIERRMKYKQYIKSL